MEPKPVYGSRERDAIFSGEGQAASCDRDRSVVQLLNTPGGYLHLIKGMAMEDKLTLSIEGMHCGGCIRRVTAALEGVKGVKLGSVEVGAAQLNFDPEQTSASRIVDALNHIGFSARVAK
jgi:copper chaperone CopZ